MTSRTMVTLTDKDGTEHTFEGWRIAKVIAKIHNKKKVRTDFTYTVYKTWDSFVVNVEEFGVSSFFVEGPNLQKLFDQVEDPKVHILKELREACAAHLE